MNDKEWNDTKQANPVLKIEVDFENYLFSDQCVKSQKKVRAIDHVLEIELLVNKIRLAKADVLMMALAFDTTPEQYEFFYNKHMLNTPLTNKGE